MCTNAPLRVLEVTGGAVRTWEVACWGGEFYFSKSMDMSNGFIMYRLHVLAAYSQPTHGTTRKWSGSERVSREFGYFAHGPPLIGGNVVPSRQLKISTSTTPFPGASTRSVEYAPRHGPPHPRPPSAVTSMLCPGSCARCAHLSGR